MTLPNRLFVSTRETQRVDARVRGEATTRAVYMAHDRPAQETAPFVKFDTVLLALEDESTSAQTRIRARLERLMGAT